MKKASIVYQFLVIISIILFNAYFIIVTKDVNEILLGALIGTLIGLPFDSKEEVKQVEKDKDIV